MIVKGLALFIIKIFDGIAVYEVPKLPDELLNYFSIFFEYIFDALNLINAYVPLDYVLTLFGISIILDLAISYYRLIIWILNKIPFIDID